MPDSNSTVSGRRRSERDQLDLFRALPGDLAARDAQDLMAYPFFSLAKSKRIVPIDFRAGTITIRVEAVPEHGLATIWDADVLIWTASQIVQARDARLKTSRLMSTTPYEILTFVGRGTSVRDYDRLKAALDRLQSTSTGGLERWLYRLVRKHGGHQHSGWSFGLVHLHARAREPRAAEALRLRPAPNRASSDLAGLSAGYHTRPEWRRTIEFRTRPDRPAYAAIAKACPYQPCGG